MIERAPWSINRTTRGAFGIKFEKLFVAVSVDVNPLMGVLMGVYCTNSYVHLFD